MLIVKFLLLNIFLINKNQFKLWRQFQINPLTCKWNFAWKRKTTWGKWKILTIWIFHMHFFASQLFSLFCIARSYRLSALSSHYKVASYEKLDPDIRNKTLIENYTGNNDDFPHIFKIISLSFFCYLHRDRLNLVKKVEVYQHSVVILCIMKNYNCNIVERLSL